MKKAIKSLRKLCIKHKVTKLAIPTLGCGLDGLKWEYVKALLNREFRSVKNIEIISYHL